MGGDFSARPSLSGKHGHGKFGGGQITIVWLCCGGWFTELGLNAVLPWQETIAVGADLLLLGAGTALALRRFRRKDVLT